MNVALLGSEWRSCVVNVRRCTRDDSETTELVIQTRLAAVNLNTGAVLVQFPGGLQLFYLATGAAASSSFAAWSLDPRDRMALANLPRKAAS